MQPVCQFKPISFSWVAIHPHPKGVIQFIGGAFFGTFPTVFYRHFLNQLFDAGYTIVALPFRFSFRHWPIAISLFIEQKKLQVELANRAKELGYEHDIYQDNSNYLWIAHSLGCKYVALLELLSGDRWSSAVEECISQQIAQSVQSNLNAIIDNQIISIKGQPSLLLAPDISDTESAVPVRSLARLLDKIGLGVLPTRKQTQRLIASSSLFNLTAMVSFDRDTVAGSKQDQLGNMENRDNSDVLWFIEHLNQKKFPVLHHELPGKHLEPIGRKVSNYIIDLNPLDKFIKPMRLRYLESVVLELLAALKKRERML